MNALGHIKIGATIKGLAAQTSKIKLVETGKGGSENFIPYNGYESGVDSIKVSLPYVHNVKENFKVAEISFVVVNNSFKYRAEIIGEDVYLFPYQPNLSNILIDLPSIKLGLAEKFKDSLQMELRAISYVNVPEFNRIFDFKTMSKFSIVEINKFLDNLQVLPANIIAGLDLELVYKKKIFKTDKFEEIRYITFSEITNEQIIEASRKKISSEEVGLLELIECIRLKESADLITNAISVEEANDFFGKNIMLKVDSIEMENFGSFGSSEEILKKVEAISEGKKKVEDKLNEQEDILSSNVEVLSEITSHGVPEPLAKSLIIKFPDNVLLKCKEYDYVVVDLVKLLSAP